jgi:hypothetical protein
MPNVRDIESKDHISMGDIEEVQSSTVSTALDIAGLSEADVDQFINEIKA